MALRAKNVFGGADFEALADKGYYKAEDLKKCVDHGITPYVARQTYSNSSGNREFYPDKFIYDKDKDVYICPMGEELTRGRQRKSKGQIIGFDYRNYGACSRCACKEQCTKSVRGRTIFRHVDQDFLDGINLQTALNMEKYRQRQMIVEHPFGHGQGLINVRPAWMQSNGCKSRVRVDSAKHIAKGKDVHREVESEGSRRQTSGLTNRNRRVTENRPLPPPLLF
jgi:hypothetical protein